MGSLSKHIVDDMVLPEKVQLHNIIQKHRSEPCKYRNQSTYVTQKVQYGVNISFIRDDVQSLDKQSSH
jgi:hypothetical protein